MHPTVEVKTFDNATWRSVKVLQAAYWCKVGKTTAVLGDFYQPLSRDWYPRVTEMALFFKEVGKRKIVNFIILHCHFTELKIRFSAHITGRDILKSEITTKIEWGFSNTWCIVTICSPVFVPQMTGGAAPLGLVTLN